MNDTGDLELGASLLGEGQYGANGGGGGDLVLSTGDRWDGVLGEAPG